MIGSRSLTTMAMTLAFVGLVLSVFGLVFALLGGSGHTGHVTIQQAIPAQIAASPEEVRENWEKLVDSINAAREMQELANATTDPVEKARFQELADILQAQAETLAQWLDSHEAVMPELAGRLVCAWCDVDMGASGTVEDSHGACAQCSDRIFGPYLK